MLARTALARAENCTTKQLPAVLDGNPLAPYTKEKTHHSVFLRLTPVEYEVFESILLKYGAVKLGKGNGKGKGLVGKEEALMDLLIDVLVAEPGQPDT